MTMFTRPRVSPTDYHESADWLRPSFGGYLSTVAQDAIHDFPTVAVADLNQLYGISAQSAGISMDYDEAGFPVVSYSKQTPDILDTATQAQRIKEAGLEKELKPESGYSGPMLDVIIERKRAELERKTTRAAAPDSWAPAGLAVGLGVSMLDPINVASAFLPIVPEARAMSLLDKAGTGLRRAAVRGGIGAVEGAGGAAALEPLTAMTRNQEQADYGLADFLSNVAFGAVFGAALHPAAGAVGDWLRAKAGMRQDWEFSPSTPDTMALKNAHAKDIFAAREAATPDADKTRLGQESQAAAALFDARARAWAYDMQRPASEYYDRWRPSYTADVDGQIAESSLTHAMYRNRSESLQGFVDEVLAGSPQDNKSFKGLGTVEREDIGIAPSEVVLASDQVRHINSGHPDFTQWADIPEVLARGEIAPLGKNKVTGGQAYAFRLRNGEKDFVVVAAPQEGKNLGKRLVVLTAFQDNPARVENWIKENKGAAFYQSAGGSPAYPSPKKGDLSALKSGSSGENIILHDAEGKTLNQPAWHGTPYHFDKFTLDHIGSGEGAQAFGWGLYFSGDKSVAEFYRETLSKDKLDENPEIKLKLKSALQDVDYLGFDNFGQAVSAISTQSDWATRWEVTPHEAENINALLKEYRKAREGQLYKVDIPEDHQLLLWDKPLSKHSEEVRSTLEAVFPEMKDEEWQTATGREIYGSFIQSEGGPRMASESLNDLGIKGIKYLDGSSRVAGEGSHNYVIFDDSAINVLKTYYQGNQKTPRAAVSFDADGKSVVQFFGSSDFSSAPHELYHVFRREMEQTAAHPDAPVRVREAWGKMQEFVGAEPGTAWTREMEEKFAKAGERFLLEGKAPSPALQDVFERLRQWFLELYASADASGLDISDDMRTVFGNMLTTPMKDGDKAFRYALGSMMTRSFVEDMDTRLPAQPDLDGKPLEAVQALSDEAVRDLDAQWRQVQEAHPDLKDVVGEAYREDVNVAEMEIAEAHRRKEILAEIAQCETRR